MFSGSDLVGILTDPPIALERAAGALEAPPVHKSRWIVVENFLTPEQHKELLALVAHEEARFVDATVSTSDPDYRRSKVLHEAPSATVSVLSLAIIVAASLWAAGRTVETREYVLEQ